MLISGVMAAAAVIGQTGHAPTKLYRMKDGDTFAKIAKLNGTGYEKLVKANPGVNPNKIRPGLVIKIPVFSSKKSSAPAAKASSGASYTVRNGDNDWSIAGRYSISASELRKLNPNVDWGSLQIGQKVRVPGQAASHSSKPSSSASVAKAKGPSKTVTVQAGDNDWKIASRLGIKPSELRASNPGVNWDGLKPGQKLAFHGGASAPAAQAAISTKRVAIARDSVRVRAGGRTSSPVKLVASKGQVGSVLDRLNDWYKVDLDGQVGWVRGDMLKAVKTAALVDRAPAKAVASSAKSGQRILVSRDSVNIRSGGSTESRVVAQVDRGRDALVLDRQGSWLKVKFSGGTQGWVRSDMVSSNGKSAPAPAAVASRPPSRHVAAKSEPSRKPKPVALDDMAPAALAGGVNSLLATAGSLMGTRYHWTGTSRSTGFDCSGFVGYVYKKYGVRLPRTSAEQSRVGQSVGRGDLMQGDLVFFKTRGNRISHVGMYIGNGQFIHSSSGKGQVTTSSLNEGYYSRRFAGARRVKDVPQGQPIPSRAGSRTSSSRRAHSAIPRLPSPQEASVHKAEPKAATSDQKRIATEDKKAMEAAIAAMKSEPRKDRVHPGTAVTGG